jgi:hypothetical protein
MNKTTKNRLDRIAKKIRKDEKEKLETSNPLFSKLLEKMDREDLEKVVNFRECDIKEEIEVFFKYCENEKEVKEIKNYLELLQENFIERTNLKQLKEHYFWVTDLEKLKNYYNLVKSRKLKDAAIVEKSFYSDLTEEQLDAMLLAKIL